MFPIVSSHRLYVTPLKLLHGFKYEAYAGNAEVVIKSSNSQLIK